MFRKPLFLGLTLMLAAALAYLVIQGRRQEKSQQTTPRPVEVIRNSPPSLTRVIAPDDLDVVESKMELETGASKPGLEKPGRTATHSVVLRNRGSASYHGAALRISYLGRANKVLGTRMVTVAELLRPGQARSISGLKVENIPAGTSKCEIQVAYCELESGPTSRSDPR